MNAREWPTYVAVVHVDDDSDFPDKTVFHAENDEHARQDGITLTQVVADAYAGGAFQAVRVRIMDYSIGFFDGAIFTGGADRLIFDSRDQDMPALLEARNR